MQCLNSTGTSILIATDLCWYCSAVLEVCVCGIELGVDYTDGDVIERRDGGTVGGRGGR